MPNTYTDTPIASHTLAIDQPAMEANYLYLANTLGTSGGKNGDHQISVGGVDNTSFEGRHRQVCLNNRHGAAPTVAGISDGTNALVYADNGNLFFGSATGAGAFQLTTYNAGTNFGGNAYYQVAAAGIAKTGGGWSFLPGGLIMNYGYATKLTPGGTVKVYYATPFPTAAISIVVTPQTSTSIGGGTHDWDIGGVSNLDYFNLTINGNYDTDDFFYFHAIGN